MNFLYPVMLEAESSLFSADQMGGYAATILITIINVAVAYFIIKKAVFKKIMKVIETREEQIKASLDDAEKSKQEAAENAAQSKAAIDEARKQANEILEEAKRDAASQSDLTRKKAETEANEMLSRASEDVVRMKKVALEEMKDEISDLSVAVAGRIIGDIVDHDKLKTLANRHTEEILEEEVDKLGE